MGEKMTAKSCTKCCHPAACPHGTTAKAKSILSSLLLFCIMFTGSAKNLEVRLWHQKGIILDEKSQFAVKVHNKEKWVLLLFF